LKPISAILLGASVVVATVAPSSSASIKSTPGKGGRVIIQLSGLIGTGDADAFVKALSQANVAAKTIESVELNSSGGKLGEGARLAAVIKSAKLPTVVQSGAVCASACFLAFAAGEPKFAGSAALIGVHKASASGGVETRQSKAATVLMAHLAKELGVPTSIVNRMMTTPPTQIAWLDAQDLHALGVKVLIVGNQISRIATASAQTSASAEQVRRPSWSDFVESSKALSVEQNHGEANQRRLCKAELSECVEAVSYQLADGRQALVMTVEDKTGRVMRREVCENNTFNDARECVDWDTGAKYHDVRGKDGTWSQNVDQ
jgi:hypothetical protein